jgi:nucleoside-diphosphate-sugar epimerase
MESGRAVLVTGSSGFIGSRLVSRMVDLGWRVVTIDLRPPSADFGSVLRGVTNFVGDYADPRVLSKALDAMDGAPDRVVCHFAAHYDFDLAWHAKYQSTNVDGLVVLRDTCVTRGIHHLIFASSMAVHLPPPPGSVITEDTVPDASIPYARSKIMGEAVLEAGAGRMPVTVLRIGGVFTEWCELPPLYGLMALWLGPWPLNRAVLGRGLTAMPYIHMDDLVDLVVTCVTNGALRKGRTTLLACGPRCVDHRSLFAAVRPGVKAWGLPIGFAGLGLRARMGLAYVGGTVPFERPWMLQYADLSLTADARRTCERTGWRCREDRDIIACVREMVHVACSNRSAWHARNRARCDR